MEIKSTIKCLSVFLFLGFLTSPSLSAIRTWDGNGGTNNWSSAANWNPDGVPTNADHVVFDGTSQKPCLVDIGVNISSFTAQGGSTATISLSGPFMFNVQHDFTMNGGLFNAASSYISVGGDWAVATSTNFNPQTSTVSLATNGSASLTGSTSFYVLVSTAQGKLILFQAGSTTTIQQQLVMEEAILRSSIAANPWGLRLMSSTNVIHGVDVRDSNASLGFQAVADPDSTDSGNNTNWLFSTAATLSPYFNNVASTSLQFCWLNLGTTYHIELSSNDFDTIVSSSITTSTCTTWTNLTEDTSYWARVKLSTETFFSLINEKSTETLIVSTHLNPYFISVSSTSIDVAWDQTGSTYTIQLDTTSSFSSPLQNSISTNTTSYFNLQTGTSYWFRVKISTDLSYLNGNTITTMTASTVTLTPLNPYSIFVDTDEISFTWDDVTTGNYQAQIATTSAFTTITSSSITSISTATFFNLMHDTTYFLRVRVSTEPVFLATNTVSTTTLFSPSSATVLNPVAVFISSISIKFDWNYIGTNFEADVSTHPSFNPILQGGIVLGTNTTQYFNLMPNTTYHFRVRLSTDAGFHSHNIISTTTLLGPPPGTDLNPFFTTVLSTRITVNWTDRTIGNYRAELSTHPSFSPHISSVTLNPSATFFGILANTTYYFQVKVSTEPVFISSNIISTVTPTIPAPPTSLNPFFSGVSSTTLGVNWTNIGGNFVTILSTHPSLSPQIEGGSLSTNNTNYFGLMPNTTYFFGVRLSTDSIISGSNQISTVTTGGASPLTNLSPFITFVSSYAFGASWANTGSNYRAQVSTDPGFGPLIADEVLSTANNNYFGLTADTTYFFRVKVSTELGYHTNNTISTTTEKPMIGTNLSPAFSTVSSTTLSITWANPVSSYHIALSTSAGFTTVTSSAMIVANTTSYAGLVPNTNYFFRVKVATEPDTSYNQTSTTTLPADGATALNPFFLGAGHDFIDVQWTHIPGNSYNAVLSTHPAFSVVTSSSVVGTNVRSFISLSSATTYYFKVKISTEPNSAYSVVIQTMTQSPAGAGNYALSFDGISNQIVTIPSVAAFDMQGNHTIEFWFRRHATAGSFQHLISKDNNPMTTGWGIVLQSDGSIRYEPFGVGGGLTSASHIHDTIWHHIALTRTSGGAATLYIDGALSNSGTTNIPNTNGASLKFGRRENGNDDFNGVIDEVRVWSEVRTLAQINSFKSQPLTGSEPNLAAYWRLDDGTGQNAIDSSSPPYDGQLGPDMSAAGDPIWVIDPIPGFGGAVDTSTPTVVILNPVDLSSRTISQLSTISGTAQDNAAIKKVEFKLQRLSDNYYWRFTNGFDFGAGNWGPALQKNTAAGATSWFLIGGDIVWSTGSYRLVVMAEDFNFNQAFTTSTFNVVQSSESILPTIGIQYPVNNSSYTASQLALLSGTAADNVALAQVFVRLVRGADGKRME